MTTNPPNLPALSALHERNAVLEASLRAAMAQIDVLKMWDKRTEQIIRDFDTPTAPYGHIHSTHDTEIGSITAHWKLEFGTEKDPMQVQLSAVYVNRNNIMPGLTRKFKEQLHAAFWEKREEEAQLEYEDSLL